MQPLLVQEAQLHDLLAAYGHVQSVWTDPMSNTGYVKFSSIEEASSVVRGDIALRRCRFDPHSCVSHHWMHSIASLQ